MPAGHPARASSTTQTSTSIDPSVSEPESIGPVSIAPRCAGPTFRHSRAEVRTAIIDWLDDTRHFGEAEGLIPNDAVSLRDGGLLDSLGLVQLVLMLEKRFDVAIDRELLAKPGSQSMSAFLDLVSGPENQP
jgi:acyl carrier protein